MSVKEPDVATQRSPVAPTTTVSGSGSGALLSGPLGGAQAILRLQRTIGNAAVGRLLDASGHRASPGGLADRVQRVLDPGPATTVRNALAGSSDTAPPPELKELQTLAQSLLDAVQAYNKAHPSIADDVEGVRQQLDRAKSIARARTDLDDRLVRAGTVSELTTFQAAFKAARDGLNLPNGLAKFLSPELKALGERQLALEHSVQEKGTLEALGRTDDPARYLHIAPPLEESMAIEGRPYPETLPLDQQYSLRVPTHDQLQSGQSSIAKVQVPSGGRLLSVLVVAGGHGGRGELFKEPGRPAYDTNYWTKNVVEPLVAQGVKATYIVLDACHTASMVTVFKPLCAPGGKIIGTMYSLTGTLVPPSVWTEIFQDLGPDAVGKVLEAGLRQRALADQTAGKANVFGVFDPARNELVHDQAFAAMVQQQEALAFDQAVWGYQEPTSWEEFEEVERPDAMAYLQRYGAAANITIGIGTGLAEAWKTANQTLTDRAAAVGELKDFKEMVAYLGEGPASTRGGAVTLH